MVFRDVDQQTQRRLDAVVALALGDFADRIDRLLEKRAGREFNGAEGESQ